MRAIVWVVDSILEDLRAFPEKARQTIGYALSEAQFGRLSKNAKPYRGYTSDGVFEIVADDSGDAYRALYATKIDSDLYVLHCFKKKSPRGGATPKPAKATIDVRLKRAKEISLLRAAAGRRKGNEA